MTNVQVNLHFLKSRNTGLKQKSADWVRARQGTIGASEISALVESSPYETPKKLASEENTTNRHVI